MLEINTVMGGKPIAQYPQDLNPLITSYEAQLMTYFFNVPDQPEISYR